MNTKREFYFGNSTKVFAYLKCESDWNEIGTESEGRIFGMSHYTELTVTRFYAFFTVFYNNIVTSMDNSELS